MIWLYAIEKSSIQISGYNKKWDRYINWIKRSLFTPKQHNYLKVKQMKRRQTEKLTTVLMNITSRTIQNFCLLRTVTISDLYLGSNNYVLYHRFQCSNLVKRRILNVPFLSRGLAKLTHIIFLLVLCRSKINLVNDKKIVYE